MSQKKSKTPKSAPKQGRGRPAGGSLFDDKVRKVMQAARVKGTTVKELAEKYNVSVAAIAYQLNKFNSEDATE